MSQKISNINITTTYHYHHNMTNLLVQSGVLYVTLETGHQCITDIEEYRHTCNEKTIFILCNDTKVISDTQFVISVVDLSK